MSVCLCLGCVQWVMLLCFSLLNAVGALARSHSRLSFIRELSPLVAQRGQAQQKAIEAPASASAIATATAVGTDGKETKETKDGTDSKASGEDTKEVKDGKAAKESKDTSIADSVYMAKDHTSLSFVVHKIRGTFFVSTKQSVFDTLLSTITQPSGGYPPRIIVNRIKVCVFAIAIAFPGSRQRAARALVPLRGFSL